jgi:hypothetical protein
MFQFQLENTNVSPEEQLSNPPLASCDACPCGANVISSLPHLFLPHERNLFSLAPIPLASSASPADSHARPWCRCRYTRRCRVRCRFCPRIHGGAAAVARCVAMCELDSSAAAARRRVVDLAATRSALASVDVAPQQDLTARRSVARSASRRHRIPYGRAAL